MSKFAANLTKLVDAKKNAAIAYAEVIDSINELFAPVEALYLAAVGAGINFEDIEDLDSWATDCIAHGFDEYDAAEAELMEEIVNDIMIYNEELKAFLKYIGEGA